MNGYAWAAIGVLIGAGLATDIALLVIFLPFLNRLDRMIDRMSQDEPAGG